MTLAINAFLKISIDTFNENFDVIIAGFDQNRKDWYFGNRYAEEKKISDYCGTSSILCEKFQMHN